jgi:hypothetical protein
VHYLDAEAGAMLLDRGKNQIAFLVYVVIWYIYEIFTYFEN